MELLSSSLSSAIVLLSFCRPTVHRLMEVGRTLGKLAMYVKSENQRMDLCSSVYNCSIPRNLYSVYYIYLVSLASPSLLIWFMSNGVLQGLFSPY